MTIEDLAARIRHGHQRGQVCLGGDRLLALARRHQLVLAVATSDLSKNSQKKLRNTCERYDVPLIFVGTAEEFGNKTGFSGIYVYAIKRNFSGFRHVLQSFEDQLEKL